MLLDFLKKAGSRIKAAVASITTKITALIRRPEPVALQKSRVRMNSLASGKGCKKNTGQCCRLTGKHSPVFSLFTFFGDSQ
jgi:hypothetical protein